MGVTVTCMQIRARIFWKRGARYNYANSTSFLASSLQVNPLMSLGHDLALLNNGGGASNRSSLSSEGFCENEDVTGDFLLPGVASAVLGGLHDLDSAMCSSSTPKGSSTLTPTGVGDPEAANGEKSSSPEDADSDCSGGLRDGAQVGPDG